MAVGRKVLFGYADIKRDCDRQVVYCDKCHNLFYRRKTAWYIH